MSVLDDLSATVALVLEPNVSRMWAERDPDEPMDLADVEALFREAVKTVLDSKGLSYESALIEILRASTLEVVERALASRIRH